MGERLDKVPTPVFLFAHGSTMMLGEESEPARVWEEVGNKALRRGIKRIIMMTLGDSIEVSMNPNPGKLPMGGVKDSRYLPYKLPAPRFDWIHDIFLIVIRMFPHCIPIPPTLVSMNARHDPHFHVKLGSALRPLRYQDTLIIGSGGSVHNLCRNHWEHMFRFSDNFAQPVPPEPWALQFRQAVEDAITQNKGPELRRALTRLMKHPRYDDHWMASLFAAGAEGGHTDNGPNVVLTECWELVNMCNTQYQLGS
ncbi:aromatic ring-opening dioxygenase family protein [Aspergillus desertorum]